MENENVLIPILSEDTVKAKINISLTKQSFFIQKLQNEADKLVFDEDNLPAISAFIEKVRKIDGVVEAQHKEIKKPYLESGKICDAAKNSLLLSTSTVVSPIQKKYTDLCQTIAERKRKAAEEKSKDEAVLKGIENNIIEFSNRIASCETNEDLLAVERVINLQKTSSSAPKYGNHHQLAIDKYDEILLPILKTQKDKVKENENLLAEIKVAEANDDIDKIDSLKEKQESVLEDIEHNKIKVQEKALDVPIYSAAPSYVQVMPDVKARRTTWEIEIVDEKAAIKGAPELLDISLNKDAAKLVMKTLKENGVLDGKTEYIKNGIRYFEKKTY